MGYAEKVFQNHTKSTNTMKFFDHEGVDKIPRKRVLTYATMVIGHYNNKKGPNGVKLTAASNLLKGVYPGDLTTCTSYYLTTSACMWNSERSTSRAQYACTYTRNVYLSTPLEQYQYMKFFIHLIP